MRRRIPVLALVLAAHALSGCDEERKTTAVTPAPVRQQEPDAVRAQGKTLPAYAPATDFSGAAPEDASNRAGAMFDGSLVRDAVSGGGAVPATYAAGRMGKRLPYTAESSERLTDLRGAVPPLPDDYDYSRSGATPGSAREAGQTLLAFARFQLEQKYATVAPVMSRLGWNAGKRRGGNTPQSPYRVTVHHTQSPQTMSEAETARVVRGIQHYHMVGRGQEGKDNFDDIGYHFLIAGDGRVVEGRRAEYLGAHAGGANGGNIGVAMMGDFDKIKPSDAQVESLTRLVTFLAIKYKKDPAAKGFLEGHQHYTNTDCPGRNLLSILGALRLKIDQEKEIIMAGDALGKTEAFVPLAVVDASSA